MYCRNFKGKTRSIINVGNCSISSRVLYLIFCSKAKLVVLMLGIVFLSMYSIRPVLNVAFYMCRMHSKQYIDNLVLYILKLFSFLIG